MSAQPGPGAARGAPMRPNLFTRTNVVALAILAASIIALAGWFYMRAGKIFVSDARISATMISVSSRLPGRVEHFPVDEGQSVREGELLARIDMRRARLDLEEAESRLTAAQAEYDKQSAQLQLTEQQLDSRLSVQRSRLQGAESALSRSQVELSQAQTDRERARSLLKEQIISQEVWESREANYEKAQQNHKHAAAELEAARASMEEARANLAQLDVLRHDAEITLARKAQIMAQRDRLQVDLDDADIRSPINAVIDETFVNEGEYVSPGQRLLMLHDPENIWIKANVKETDIRHVEPGAPVRVTVDAYPGREFEGTVARVGNSATSQFALLPSPNPSGNFTKITQRLEVKIGLDQVGDLLKPGMMVELEIESH